MSDQRFIIEMGMGNDQHGQDYTKAAARAIEDALRHSSLSLMGVVRADPKDFRIKVTVGVQAPDQVDCAALAKVLPVGKPEVQAVFGGLDVTNPDSGGVVVIASAAVEVFLPRQG